MFELTLTKATTAFAIFAGIYVLRKVLVRRFDYTKIDLQGKVAIVTGSNDGIGKATALVLAKQRCKVYLFCRDSEKSRNALRTIREESANDQVHLIPVDFADLGSIRSAADRFLSQESKLNILINNAAVLLATRQLTESGLEMQFAVNHLAPFYLTELLLPTLKASSPARIVNVSSAVAKLATLDFSDMDMEKSYGMMRAYQRSKLCNILHVKYLDRMLQGAGVTANACHPGGVHTGLLGRDFLKTYPWTWPLLYPLLETIQLVFFRTPEEGAMTSLYLAMDPTVEGNGGGYWDNLRRNDSFIPQANDDDLRDKLYQFSQDAVKK
ncbi:hypothetical protein BCR43DRAFT_493259 [Syncephalastrum racemosum]|uniref:Uncharacterized protein n=1 Tax=Syncephalastrum racemosum TaxID=13706 RepID=A0A1X2HAD2_SYNRA|nr:hypothetical protein BCR43DRAFT_493259 [Syncephalastrum racemosum]